MKSKSKLFAIYVLIAIITIITAEFAFWVKGYEIIYKQGKNNSIVQTKLLADLFLTSSRGEMVDIDEFVKVYSEKYKVRITLIDEDGNVLADSEISNENIENQKDSYTEIPLINKQFQGVLRVSKPLTELSDLNAELTKQVILLLGVCVLIVIAVLAWQSEKENEKEQEKKKDIQLSPTNDRNLRKGVEEIVESDALVINKTTRSVTMEGSLLTLSKKEFELLCLMAENKGRVFSREILLEKVWGYDYYGESRTVDVHIRNLRKKIEKDGEHPKYIITVRGYGYKFM